MPSLSALSADEHSTTAHRLIVGALLAILFAPGCAAVKKSNELWRRGWSGFASPGETTAVMGLTFADGYQPGKIPVVFIHGLLSDSMTWEKTIEELQADPYILSHFQFWTYRYPTGNSYLSSAADMREELTQTLDDLDP